MEERFVLAWIAAREEAAGLGVRLRPMAETDALRQAHLCLQSHRPSDGFAGLVMKGKWKLTLEALAIDRRFTALFSDREVNTALQRLLEAECFGTSE